MTYTTPRVRQFLEFGIIDIGAVKSDYLVVVVMARSKHEESLVAAEVNCTSQGTPSLAMYYRVYLDTSLLLSRLGVSANTLENSVGEQCDCSGIDNPKLLYPLFRAVASAVR